MSESWIKVGAKCRCIRKVISRFPDKAPTVGGIYTIREVVADGWFLLVEIVNPIWPRCLSEVQFDPSFFRPLVSERDDVAAFEAIAFKPKLDIELEQLETAWRMSEADEMPAYGTVIADDADLRWIEEQARGGGGK